MNHYETLGVSPDASKQEIIVAHRKLAAKAHPDAGGSVDEFKRIQEAYRILSDERERAHYDKTGRQSVASDDIRSRATSFVLDAFMRDGEDPIKVARRQASESEREAKRVAADSSKKARKLKAKIVRFRQRNANVRNTESRDDLVLALLNRYEDIERHRKSAEEQAELFGKVVEYLEGLSCPPDESEESPFRHGMRARGFSGGWASTGSW